LHSWCEWLSEYLCPEVHFLKNSLFDFMQSVRKQPTRNNREAHGVTKGKNVKQQENLIFY
jgi:hypothetical protein